MGKVPVPEGAAQAVGLEQGAILAAVVALGLGLAVGLEQGAILAAVVARGLGLAVGREVEDGIVFIPPVLPG